MVKINAFGGIKMKILAFSANLDGFEKEIERFSGIADVDFVISDAVEESEVVAAARDADIILFASTKLNRAVISKLEKCKLIVRYGIGYDTVDTTAAREKGIFVCNSPNYGIIDVAEHAISLLLSAAKRLTYLNARVNVGEWALSDEIGPATRLAGKTVGFVGFGNIGKAVCRRTNAFDMKPIVYDPFVSDEALREYGAERKELEELLAESDFVSLHLPLNEKTRGSIGARELSKMKKTAVLINTSRGGIINEKELAEALESGTIAAVGLDVFENESGKLDGRLLNSKRSVFTPHVAWNTDRAMPSLHAEVIGNVLRFLKGERPNNVVNGL